MKVKTKVFWFKIWAELLLVILTLVVTWMGIVKVPISPTTVTSVWHSLPLWVISILYFYGKYLERKETRHYY